VQTGTVKCAKLQSDHHHLITKTLLITGRMLFNQITEGHVLRIRANVRYFTLNNAITYSFNVFHCWLANRMGTCPVKEARPSIPLKVSTWKTYGDPDNLK